MANNSHEIPGSKNRTAFQARQGTLICKNAQLPSVYAQAFLFFQALLCGVEVQTTMKNQTSTALVVLQDALMMLRIMERCPPALRQNLLFASTLLDGLEAVLKAPDSFGTIFLGADLPHEDLTSFGAIKVMTQATFVLVQGDVVAQIAAAMGWEEASLPMLIPERPLLMRQIRSPSARTMALAHEGVW
jgi:hypothetical protein